MTRSVEELRRESERSRAELAATVDQLRERISDTAEDIRHKVSPQHIKSEVSDYVSHKTQSWVEAIKQRAMENPMQAIATSTAVAVPVLRLARGSSLPLLMIGAGLALTSKTVRDRAAEVAAQATSTVSDKFRSGMDAAKDTAAAAKDAAATAPARARQVIGDNAALIGGLGIAIGAIIAAALPQTKAETKVMGQASDSVKQAAGEAAQSGFEAAKDATMSAADAAAKSVSEADLGGHASRMTQNMTDKLKEAADDVVTAAFNPSRNPNT
jgi:ElaB/YqjD/DUF883 family membrane-anchored ribosome-binding protein